MTDIKEKLTTFPDTQSGKHWLFWLSLVAASLTAIQSLRGLQKGRAL